MLFNCNIPLPERLTAFLQNSVAQIGDVYLAQISNSNVLIFKNGKDISSEYDAAIGEQISKFNKGWYQETELPFSSKKFEMQTSLESELMRDYLMVGCAFLKENKVYPFVQFKPFAVSTNNYLMANEKLIIERITTGICETVLREYNSDKKALKSIAVGNEYLKEEVKEISANLRQQNANYDLAITKFTTLIVNKLATKYNIAIKQSGAFIQALRTYSYSFEILEETLAYHIESEINMVLALGKSEMQLEPRYLVPQKEPNSVPASKPQKTIELGRYTNTYNLLSRYEKAAELALQNGLSIIGKNIGKMCEPSVSNASITDALNKHARKIYELFNRYPENWPIIRNEFKSVLNVLSKEAERRKAIA